MKSQARRTKVKVASQMGTLCMKEIWTLLSSIKAIGMMMNKELTGRTSTNEIK
jgi:hypothetical protein